MNRRKSDYITREERLQHIRPAQGILIGVAGSILIWAIVAVVLSIFNYI